MVSIDRLTQESKKNNLFPGSAGAVKSGSVLLLIGSHLNYRSMIFQA
jgi:hypothetical protein